MLSRAELDRYDRQLLLAELGIAGQERLKQAAALVVGAGGLGSPVALYLAAAGVGKIGIADSDRVDPSNLHRQTLHGTPDIGREKTASAIETLARLNPEIDVVAHHMRITARNASDLVSGYDVIIDGSDNYPTRYAINDACVEHGRPWIYGSVERFSGQVSVFGLADGPCYRCVFPEPPAAGATASCDEIGVLGAVPGVIGAMQAVEALKVLAAIGSPLSGRLLQIEFARGETRVIRFDRRADCPACGRGSTETGMQPRNEDRPELPDYEIEPRDVPARLREAGVRLLDIREPWEVQRARIDGATLLPMSELEARVESLDRDEELIVMCHRGSRSRMVTDWLRAQGYRARNLAGGIDQWSREVDPAVPRY